MSCNESENVLCKHVRAERTFYVDLDDLPEDVTVVSGSASSEDVTLVISSVAVIAEDLVIEQTSDCAAKTLIANRAILFTISGGTPSDDEVIVTVEWTQSDGDIDSRDCRLLVGGTS